MRETSNLEFKEKVSNTFLKTVSAFANYDGGKILFGVNDQGKSVGLDNPVAMCQVIEHKINDSIQPLPKYNLTIEDKIVILDVAPGFDQPYFYKSKAYRRNDSATIEVDRLELMRLIIAGENVSYDVLTTREKDLSFHYLEKKLQEVIGIEKLNDDILLTLELLSRNKEYTQAGYLFSDQNSHVAIDMIEFGWTQDTIKNRYILDKMSILEGYDEAMRIFHEKYQYEIIQGSIRQSVEKIPEKAFREAIANALVHRDWLLPSSIQIAMTETSIQITSPGGLPAYLSEEEYLNGQISTLRNPVIANLFFRLNIIEQFGTGIQRIKKAYQESAKKPLFKIFENSIQIILPVIAQTDHLSEDLQQVYHVIEHYQQPSSEIVEKTGFGKNKVLNLLEELIDKGYAEKIGNGRGTKYKSL